MKQWWPIWRPILRRSRREASKPEIPAFVDFLADTVSRILPLVKKYSYDGIIVGYRGKNTLHMDDAEKQLYTAYEKAFIGIAEDWHERNKDKMILFEGYPQNLLNKSILEKCRYIIIPSAERATAQGLPII